MRASLLIGARRSEVRDLPTPTVGPCDVLVRVRACGVCRSELEDWQSGSAAAVAPLVMGHEPSGIVEAVGADVATVRPGDRVTLFTGRAGRFTDYTSGGYAEQVAVAEANVVRVPASVPFEHALGEPLACLMSAFERTPVGVSDRVAVIGCGFMGLALLQLLRLRSPRELVAIDVSPDARSLAVACGAHRAIAPDETRRVRWWKDGDAGFDVVVEASGAGPALTLAGEIANAHATVSIVGYHGVRQVDVGLWNIKALTVINAHEKRRDYFLACMRRGIDLVADGRLDMRRLVTHTYPLGDVDRAFADLQAKAAGHTKGVVLI